jgi:hypothetical protein
MEEIISNLINSAKKDLPVLSDEFKDYLHHMFKFDILTDDPDSVRANLNRDTLYLIELIYTKTIEKNKIEKKAKSKLAEVYRQYLYNQKEQVKISNTDVKYLTEKDPDVLKLTKDLKDIDALLDFLSSIKDLLDKQHVHIRTIIEYKRYSAGNL